MKLLNQSLKYLLSSIFIIISLWATIFYFDMLNEIKESVDEGLENYKRQIIYRSEKDSTILQQSNFEEGFFAIHEISKAKALLVRDVFVDTLMFMQDSDDEVLELEPVRILTTAFQHSDKFYELKIMNSMVEEDDLIEELLFNLIWLYLLLIAAAVLINNFVLKRLWKPFYDFLSQLKNYRLGNNHVLPNVKTKTKEFHDLQEAVNTLLIHSVESYDQQKEFIGNASHELQTPLAIATAKLEILLEEAKFEDQQAKSIAEILEMISRMVRLNKSLLLLTKIENKQFFDNQTISMNEVVKQNLRDLEEIAEYKEIEIVQTETDQLTLEMDFSLANIIVSNLLRNAIFHTDSGGKVTVEIVQNVLRIRNTAKNTPLDSSKIFTRFYKSENEQSGTGLGLAIVKAICLLYGFSVSYGFEGGEHCFEVRFK